MKIKDFKFNLIKKDTQTLISAYRWPLVIVSVLMGFLIFIMNVFFAGAIYGHQFNSTMKDKLWVYIYINDAVAQDEKQIFTLKEDLEAKGLRVQYSSQQDALGFVEKRVPDLTTTLKKYQLKNPLPSTLYIMYNDQEQFTSMKTLLEKNKNLILNMNDLSENAIKTQEKRVLNIINLSNFMQSFGYLVVLVMLAAVIWFAIFFLNAIFSHFKRDIQAKKLLGATAHQIAQPFLQVIFKTLLFAFIIAVLLLVATTLPLEHYLQVLFNFSLLNHISIVIFELLATGIIEIWMIMLILMAVSYCYVLRLHKQLK